MSGLVRGEEIDNTAGCSRERASPRPPAQTPAKSKSNSNSRKNESAFQTHSVSKHWVVVFVELCDSSESHGARGQALVAGPL